MLHGSMPGYKEPIVDDVGLYVLYVATWVWTTYFSLLRIVRELAGLCRDVRRKGLARVSISGSLVFVFLTSLTQIAANVLNAAAFFAVSANFFAVFVA